MAHYQLYPLLLIGCFAYTLWLGGAPERIGGAIIFLGTCATFFAATPEPVRFSHIEWGIVGVDIAILIAFLALALTSARHWPQWIAALQILEIASHFVATVPGTIRSVYAMAVGFLVYPMLIILVIATTLHWLRKRTYGTDPSWRRSSSRSVDQPHRTFPPSS